MTKQLAFKKVNGWGGKRRGAGRPNKSGLVAHGKRERVDFKKPLHITMRLKAKMASLRTRQILSKVKIAADAGKRLGFHIVHFSLQGNHLHMIVEARDNRALGRGLRSFGCRIGKLVRKATGGVGRVFAGRYHLHVLKTPTEVKRALEYVLLNWNKHRGLIEGVEPYGSAVTFGDWRALLGRKSCGLLDEHEPDSWPELSAPRSWLLTQGWRRAREFSKTV